MRPVAGRVRTAEHHWVGEAEVLPCLVDEVFGLVEPLQQLARQTDAEGRFELGGLPVDLDRHQSIVLLVTHPKHPTTALKILPTTIASSVAGTSARPSSTSPRVGLSAKETVGPARPRADMKDPAVPPTSRAPSSIDPK